MSHQPQNEALTKPASPKLVAIHTQSSPLVNSGQVVKSQLSAGEVALVGAGPGDPELLTLKAFHYLQQADVVLYDYLVSDAIMALIPAHTQTLCVGKRAGQHSMPQEAINQHLVDFALQGLRVVRIKGGDPFMFGRGGEELEALFDAGIRFQVVPGITAAAGATAYAGIPLTHRDYAQSALFMTGHLKAGEQDNTDWATLAITNQTLVIYMGLMKADYIRQQLMAHGRAAATPVAIIERGTDSAQKVYQGELSDLAVLAQGAGSPALIVIGDVVKLASKLAWFNQEPTLNSQYQYA